MLQWTLGLYAIQTVAKWLIKKWLEVPEEDVQVVISRVAKWANATIDGNPISGDEKWRNVRNDLGLTAERIIRAKGQWAYNLLIEICVGLVKEGLKIEQV